MRVYGAFRRRGSAAGEGRRLRGIDPNGGMTGEAGPALAPDAFATLLAAGVPALDMRPWHEFRNGHVPGAVNVPFTSRGFLESVVEALPLGAVGLVDDLPHLTRRAWQVLTGHGYEVAGVLAGGTRVWARHGRGLARVEEWTPAEVASSLQTGRTVTILDVREAFELRGGRIPGAVNVPLSHLGQAKERLDRRQEYVLVCRSGHRSAAAQAYLHRHGFRAVWNLAGGMLAWVHAGLPVEKA
jgi:hydroxyacylglutathione hydrolase